MPSQAERSASTRQSLIDAAATLLIEQGYAAFAEARVCELAGTSRGSLRHHFPEGRYDLLPAMLKSLLEREADRLAALGPLGPSLRMHLMLHVLANRPQRHASLAILEVWMATRGDIRLARAVHEPLASVPQRLFGQPPDAPPQPEWLALRCFLHGATLHSFAPDYDAQQLSEAVRWLIAQLPRPDGLDAVLARMLAQPR
ncbi:Putative transcriptional regulator; TetR family [Cupriavidus phytorum]|uniref:Transcriptional regulator TetR family n=2 Tax=Cupriavidus TaxID=106589 RepID=A0A976FRP3_9BURK|nr:MULTISPECIES: TetR/AcrR family transcriptional regulator [Cupriavidus]PZX26071.1 TetR family transcriptional regulator [Cupriavidus alkaliphilus]SOY76213.1 Putative transcriptional regulator; TetR family [Cupriavidus taiwanensis]